MRKSLVALLAGIVCIGAFCGGAAFAVSAETAGAETTGPAYKLAVGDFEYGVYTPDASGNTSLWWGAPNNTNAYVNDSNIVAPGSDYATAIAFTAPTDGKISPAWGLGAVKRTGQVTDNTDGVRFSVFLNDTKVFPSDGLWADVPQVTGGADTSLTISFDELTVQEGDKLYYIVDNGGNGNSEWDMCYMLMGFRWEDANNPSGVWYDSDAGYWTDETSGQEPCPNLTAYKKSELTSYHYLTIKELTEYKAVETEEKQVKVTALDFEFTEVQNTPLWSGAPIREGYYCYVNGNQLVPCEDYAAAIRFTAPCDGYVSNAAACGTVFRRGEVNELTDGSRISVVLNDTVLYPYEGVWADVPQGLENAMEIVFNSTEIKAGDTLYYIVDCGGKDNAEWDIDQLDAGFIWTDEKNPNGVYIDFSENYWTDEASGSENVSFGEYAKSAVFSYHYVTVEERNAVPQAEEYTYRTVTSELIREELTYSKNSGRYYRLDDPNLFVYPDYCDPGDFYSLGIVWTAPEDGRVDLSGTWIRNFFYQTEVNADGIRSDGVRVKIMIGEDKEIYPADNEWLVINDSNRYEIDVKPFAVKAGEEIVFILDNNGACNYDLCKFDINIAFAAEGAEYTAQYSNITDFGTESENAEAWSYYGLAAKAEDEGGETDIKPITVVTYSAGGCGSSLSGGGVALVALTAISALYMVKRKEERK